ncbi:MAG: hypothetical protein LC791_13245 [Acidobacteria bacterium]|nr:hypothetical protein [Acidobacteriota bacterium]
MSAELHAVWPRTPGTRLRLRPARPDAGTLHVVEVLSLCAGLTRLPATPLDVLYVHLPGGDDLFRLASRAGGRLGPTGCVPGARVQTDGAQSPVDFADLGVVTLGSRVSAAEARAAARLVRELACRYVLLVVPVGQHAEGSARALAEACRTLLPSAHVDLGSFGPWSRQPDFVSVSFEAPPECALELAA